jgi:hypothetical protein
MYEAPAPGEEERMSMRGMESLFRRFLIEDYEEESECNED